MTIKLKGLQEGRWRRNSWWWFWLRTKRTCRVLIAGKGGSAAVVFSVFTIWLMIVLFFLSLQPAPFTERGLAGTSLLIILAAIGGGIWALHIMSPQEYAQITIAGCTASETLQLIALDIKKACSAFEVQVRNFPTEGGPDREQRIVLLKKFLPKLKREFAKQHATLLKIDELLRLASEHLDIPLHRLRDLIFEYDPAMHRALVRKFIQNCELLSAGADLNDTHEGSLWADNKQIVEKAKARIMVQLELLRYTSLHPSILRMAAVHSTAQATQEYARAVSHVARLTCEQTPDGSGSWDKPAKEKLSAGMSALCFLARRQRAHPGFDLNQACLNMAVIGEYRDQKTFTEFQRGALNELGRSIEREALREESSTPLFAPHRNLLNDECRKIRQAMQSLETIWVSTVNHIQFDRRGVVESFGRLYGGWIESHSAVKKTLLITHGFSTTVREIFKRGLPTIDTTMCHEGFPDIFVVGSGDPSDLDSRLMVSALKSVRDRRFRRIAAGDKNALVKLVENDMKVMVVLGAECFDRTGRVIHPWGLEEVEFIAQKIGYAPAFCVVIVAEGYKYQEDLLANPQVFRHHLDRIQLYEPGLVDVIVTTDIESRVYERRCVTLTPAQYGRKNLRHQVSTVRKMRGEGRDPHIARRPVHYDPETQQQITSEEFDLVYKRKKATIGIAADPIPTL